MPWLSCDLLLYQLAGAEVGKEMDACEFDRCSEVDLACLPGDLGLANGHVYRHMAPPVSVLTRSADTVHPFGPVSLGLSECLDLLSAVFFIDASSIARVK